MSQIHHSGSLTPSSSPVTHVKSLWHSPVPYLFGGLACMMCLIAIALMFLACSYWKLNRNLRNSGGAARDLEAGDSDLKPENDEKTAPPFFEEKFLVIMAGEHNPTFLATLSSSRTSSFGSNDQVQVRNMGSHESNDQVS
ncbi:hypothetical protein CTI12_AA324890 [Artemisia annua]|uniref:Uncharacterized protein n=1 Tax=Artemisia annua TaxID=35608 RepID=A0A2U1MZX1_ARTAN|nr:hypothetical protein CTI12_AA324890 [Artemisia annua]